MPCSKSYDFFDQNAKRISLFVFAVDIIVLVAVLAVLWAMPEPHLTTKDCGYMCLRCTNDSEKMCCGCRADVLKDFMEGAFKHSYEEISSTYKEQFKESRAKIHNGSVCDVKPVAHLKGKDREEPVKDDKGTDILSPIKKWQRGSDCLLVNGISLHRGRYRVPVSGFYHVYSGIDFSYLLYKKSNIVEVETKSPCMRHAIFKSNIKSPSIEEEVMCIHHPYELSKNLLFSKYDTYIGGDVYLEAGDEVYVKIANISYASSPPMNVFGIHLI